MPGVLLFGDSLLTGLLADWLVSGEGERLVVPSVFVAGWLGMLATALNLFPVGQLDGGHVTYALSRRAHRLVSRLTIAGMLFLVGFSVIRALIERSALPSLMIWTVVLVLLGSRHPPVRDETVPLGPGRHLLALVGLLIFVLCFMADPIQIAE